VFSWGGPAIMFWFWYDPPPAEPNRGLILFMRNSAPNLSAASL
jgi:hypothetical protein